MVKNGFTRAQKKKDYLEFAVKSNAFLNFKLKKSKNLTPKNTFFHAFLI